jgi:hypothetical protein
MNFLVCITRNFTAMHDSINLITVCRVMGKKRNAGIGDGRTIIIKSSAVDTGSCL